MELPQWKIDYFNAMDNHGRGIDWVPSILELRKVEPPKDLLPKIIAQLESDPTLT